MNKLGKLDVDEVIRIGASVGISLKDIGELTLAEILAYQEGYHQSQRSHYETMEYVIAMGYASAQKGKLLPLFKDEGKEKANSKPKVKKLTREEREAELKALNQTFGGVTT